MKERILSLAQQAGLKSKSETAVSLTEAKFAELIVRECADVASINQHQYNSTGTYVLKHFGIE